MFNQCVQDLVWAKKHGLLYNSSVDALLPVYKNWCSKIIFYYKPRCTVTQSFSEGDDDDDENDDDDDDDDDDDRSCQRIGAPPLSSGW